MAELIPGPTPQGEPSNGWLPREETKATFYGVTLTNKRLVVELPEYVHSIEIEQVSELAFTVIPFWQRWDSAWGFFFRSGIVALVAAGFAGAFALAVLPGEPLGWLFPITVGAVGCAAAFFITLWRVLSAPTCVVNVATAHGVAGYPIRIPSGTIPKAKDEFREFLTRTMVVREDPSVRRTLGFGSVERHS